MIPKKVLVVDDEKHLRMLYQAELQGEGYTVATSDGTEPILEVVKREDPAVIVLDIKIGPDISGLNLLQEIRSSELDRPVILSTAYDAFQHDLKSIAATAYVVKSVDLTDLKEKIAEAMKG
jgi:DNA-binding NtrC family response regulator